MTRADLLSRLSRGFAERARERGVLRVAIDGPDATGKTTFARDLGDVLRPLLADGAEVRRFSIDDLMVPIQVRRSEIAADPQWLYENFLDLARIREIATGLPENSPPGTVVVLDGMTLQRPELADLWDVVLYLTASDELVIARSRERYARYVDETEEPHELDDMERRYVERYIPAYQIYLDSVNPADRADVLIDMTDFDAPLVKRWDGF